MYRIVLADTRKIAPIIHIAEATWKNTYTGIITQEQIAFMYEKMYCESSLKAQMQEGYIFAIAYDDNYAIGFVSYKEFEEGVFVSKLYVRPEFQKNGVGTFLLSFVEDYGKERDKKWIRLNVNRNNPAHLFYKKGGFFIAQVVDIPYYSFELNDFVMQKDL